MNTRFSNAGEEHAVRSLSALAQASRLRVFRLLVGASPAGLHPGQIADTLQMPASALSFHLRELLDCGLVTQQREGRFLRYRADLSAMRGLVDFLTAHCCEGHPCDVAPDIACTTIDG